MGRKNKVREENNNLSDMQDRFCHEYIKDLNGTQAAIRAGYQEKSAKTSAARLLSYDNVCRKIRQLVEERNHRVKVDADTVLVELLKIAKSDIRKLFDENGVLKNPKDFPDDMAGSVASMVVEETWEGYGEQRQMTGYLRKVKLWDKPRALELLGRHLALFIDRSENISENTIKIESNEKDL